MCGCACCRPQTQHWFCTERVTFWAVHIDRNWRSLEGIETEKPAVSCIHTAGPEGVPYGWRTGVARVTRVSRIRHVMWCLVTASLCRPPCPHHTSSALSPRPHAIPRSNSSPALSADFLPKTTDRYAIHARAECLSAITWRQLGNGVSFGAVTLGGGTDFDVGCEFTNIWQPQWNTAITHKETAKKWNNNQNLLICQRLLDTGLHNAFCTYCRSISRVSLLLCFC